MADESGMQSAPRTAAAADIEGLKIVLSEAPICGAGGQSTITSGSESTTG
jgi:hypothetical protein